MPRRLIWLIGALVIVLAAGALAYQHYHRPAPPTVQMQPAKGPSTPGPIQTGGHPLSSVPAQSQQRAKAAGYYCPSWDASPGQVSPSICYPIYDDTQP